MADLQLWLPTIAALLATGIFAGLLAGLLGVGGGIVIVPVLFFIFQSIGIPPGTAMPVATATSLLTIVATSLSSMRSHQRRGNIDWPLVKQWTPAMLVGVLAGTLTATLVHGLILSMVFGIVALLVALNMLLRASAEPLTDHLPGRPVQYGAAAGIGYVSVLMGIGAGTLGVPSMTAMNISAHRAVGTATVFGLVIALPSALLLLLVASTPAQAPAGTMGLVNLPGFLIILPMSTLMAPVGVRIGARLNAQRLKQVFAFFLAVVGIRMLWQSFF